MRDALPERGLSRAEIFERMDAYSAGDIDWRRGRVPLYVFKANDEIAALGATLLRLLQHQDQRKELGRHAAARARSRVAPDVVYAKYEHAYEVAIEHLRAHPPEPTKPSRPIDAMRLANHHVWPWLWQHSVLCTVGLFRGAHGYQPPKHMRIDAMPDPPEPEE